MNSYYLGSLHYLWQRFIDVHKLTGILTVFSDSTDNLFDLF